MAAKGKLFLAGDSAADDLLASDDFALMLGMLLDQQIPMETAFAGPHKLASRMPVFSAPAIAEIDPETFIDICRQPPAVHRFPGSMGKRIRDLAQVIVDDYDGDAAGVWRAPTRDGTTPDGPEILRRLKALPGFGDQKSRIFLALLGKAARAKK